MANGIKYPDRGTAIGLNSNLGAVAAVRILQREIDQPVSKHLEGSALPSRGIDEHEFFRRDGLAATGRCSGVDPPEATRKRAANEARRKCKTDISPRVANTHGSLSLPKKFSINSTRLSRLCKQADVVLVAERKACREAGLSDKIPHDFRRTAVR